MEPPLISLGREKHSQGMPAAPASHMHSSTRSKARSQTNSVPVPPPNRGCGLSHLPHSAPNHARQAPGEVSGVPQVLAVPLPPPHMHICQGQFHWHNAQFPKTAKPSRGALQRKFSLQLKRQRFGRLSMKIQAELVHVFRRLFLKLEAAHFSAGDVLTPLTPDTPGAQPSPGSAQGNPAGPGCWDSLQGADPAPGHWTEASLVSDRTSGTSLLGSSWSLRTAPAQPSSPLGQTRNSCSMLAGGIIPTLVASTPPAIHPCQDSPCSSD